MMTSEESFTFKGEQRQIPLSAPLFSAIPVIQFLGNLQNQDMVIFCEQFPAFGDGRNSWRTTPFFPEGIAPKHAFESYPLTNENVVPGNPSEFVKAMFAGKSFY
jgi:hypothetical protein